MSDSSSNGGASLEQGDDHALIEGSRRINDNFCEVANNDDNNNDEFLPPGELVARGLGFGDAIWSKTGFLDSKEEKSENLNMFTNVV
ncbi:hypothetical protein ACLB2K_012501 [Fragaria x ananassa]